MDVLNGRGDGEVSGHGLHHLTHGLDLQAVGSNQSLLLLLQGPVSFVHWPKLVATAAHSVCSYS